MRDRRAPGRVDKLRLKRNSRCLYARKLVAARQLAKSRAGPMTDLTFHLAGRRSAPGPRAPTLWPLRVWGKASD